METSVAQLIVQMVSPAVMISACGLMWLTLGNKYGRAVDRIRALGVEVRALQARVGELVPADAQRLQTLNLQLPDLLRRGRLLRNSMLHFYSAVGLFVASSFAIALVQFGVPAWVPVILFCVGMGSVLMGTTFAWREALLSFRLIRLEVPAR